MSEAGVCDCYFMIGLDALRLCFVWSCPWPTGTSSIYWIKCWAAGAYIIQQILTTHIWPLLWPRTPRKLNVHTRASKCLSDLTLAYCLDIFPTIFRSHQAPCCFSHMPSSLLPQSLCTCCPLHLYIFTWLASAHHSGWISPVFTLDDYPA